MGMALGLILVILVLGGLVLLLRGAGGGVSDEDIFNRFSALSGFTITERHAHDGSGLAADETRGLIAVQAKGREKLILMRSAELATWRYQQKDGIFEMSLKTFRHPEPLIVTFRKSATADEWLKIFMKMKEEFA